MNTEMSMVINLQNSLTLPTNKLFPRPGLLLLWRPCKFGDDKCAFPIYIDDDHHYVDKHTKKECRRSIDGLKENFKHMKFQP